MKHAHLAPTNSDNVIIAPEGFIDSRAIPHQKDAHMRVIMIRTLADIPVLKTVYIDGKTQP